MLPDTAKPVKTGSSGAIRVRFNALFYQPMGSTMGIKAILLETQGHLNGSIFGIYPNRIQG